MDHSNHFTVSLLASLLLASPALAQTPQTPEPSTPTANGDVEDMSNVTMQSPNTPGTVSPQSAPAPQAPPAAVAPAAAPPPPPVQTIVLTTPPEAPSTEPVHQGFYLRMVQSPAFVSFSGAGPNGNAKMTGLGSTSVIALGGSIARGVVLGGMLQATQVSAKFNGGPFIDANVTTSNGSFRATNKAVGATSAIGLLLDWYPNPSGGWHAGLAGGFGGLMVQNLADESSMMGTGLSGRLFGGYDFSISRVWSLGLGLSLSGMTSSTLKDSDDSSIDTGYRLKSLSVGFDASILYF